MYMGGKSEMRVGKIKIERKTLQIAFFVIISILAVVFIFSNSMQPAQKSAAQSRVVAKGIQTILDSDAVGITKKFHALIRKIAHIVEFAILGVGIGGLFYSIRLYNNKTYVSLPLLLGLSVGICDEFIQCFGSRKSLVSDVLIDFGGVLLGMFAISIIMVFIKKIKRKNK